MSAANTQEQFATLRKKWVECLSGKDINSINNQLYQLIWNAVSYRTINEARRFAPAARGGGVELNGMMHCLIDTGFSDSQVLAVRRLIDNAYGLHAEVGKSDRSIFSLGALLKDMRKNAPLFTRENMLAAEGLEYDVAAVRKKEDEYSSEKYRSGETTFFVPPEMDPDRPEGRHRDIDQLSGVSPENRQPKDTVRSEVFEALTEKVSAACEQIGKFATKFRAHAASPSSRTADNVDGISVTLKRLSEAHVSLCRTAQFIGGHLLGNGTHLTYLPMASGDILQYIERPLVTEENLPQLRRYWEQQAATAMEWQAWEPLELLSPPAGSPADG